MANWLENFSAQGFMQMNDPQVKELGGGKIEVSCGAIKDMFRDTDGEYYNDTAAYLYKEVEGDFICTLQGAHAFVKMYDAFAILAWQDSRLFTKVCYEGTDFGTRSVISVVTNGLSDDSNGPNVNGDSKWLRMIRKGNVFMHEYSEDGQTFYLTRRYFLEMPTKIKVGMAVQSPEGQGTTAVISFFEIK